MSGYAGVLVVEDEAPQRKLLAEILRKEGFEVREASTGEKALEAVAESCPDLVLCDWRLPGIGGGDVLRRVRELEAPCAFVVLTAYGSIPHAMEAIRFGADDYLAKPFEREALLIAVRRVLRTSRLERENQRLRKEITEREGFGDICGRAESMRQLFRVIDKVAATDVTVLISGESGTGKELVARTLHQRSPRCRQPFVAVNCAAIPETLMESELFGYEKGAFTGAASRREGRFEEARGGTLFLDEIPSMPLPLQGVLLRVLQERKITRLGGKGEVECDVRLVAATNRDLPRMVSEGAFREDLYYRLNVVPIRVPPLRERREDVPALVGVLLSRAAGRHKVAMPEIPQDVVRLMVDYRWPGNVRELANVLERLVLLAEHGRARPEDLPEEMRCPAPPEGCPFRLPPGGLQWDDMEAGLLRQALDLAAGNRTSAARLLGMSYKAFLYRIEKFGM